MFHFNQANGNLFNPNSSDDEMPQQYNFAGNQLNSDDDEDDDDMDKTSDMKYIFLVILPHASHKSAMFSFGT